MKSSHYLFPALIMFAASTSLAYANEGEFEPFFEAVIMGGIASLHAGDSTIDMTASETDKLVQTNENDWNSWIGQLGLGYVFQLTDEWASGEVQWFPLITPQLNLYVLGNGEIKGDMYQYESAALNNLDYTADFNSTRVMFDLNVTLAAIEQFSVYALAGAGIAWNTIDFQATPNLNGLACGANGFNIESASSTSFAYEFGAGLTYAMADDIALSLEYLYTGLNDVGIGNEDDIGFDLQSADFDMNTQAVLFGVRFAL